MKLLSLLLTFIASALAADAAVSPEETVCIGMLALRYQWDTCKASGKGKAKTITACACAHNDFILTNLNCIEQLVANVTESQQEETRTAAYTALAKACKAKGVKVATLKSMAKNATELPAYDPVSTPTGGYTLPASKNGAFKVPEYEAYAAIHSYNLNLLSQPRSHAYGRAVIIYWFGIVVLRTIFYWAWIIIPGAFKAFDCKPIRLFRRYITLPALFGTRHSSQPALFKYFTFNLPTRQATLIVVGFAILNVILDFANLPFWRGDNYSYENNLAWQYSRLMATRTGYLACYCLPLLFLFGGRNNFMIYMTGWSLDTFNVFHKWLGRIIFFNLLSHASAFTLVRCSQGRYQEMWSTPYWNWGVVGFVFCGVIVFASMHAFRRLNYEFFLLFHILCAIMFIVGGYWHLRKLDDELDWHYAAMAVWGFDRLVRFVRIILSNPFAKARVTAHDGAIIEMTINYSKLWKVFPGSYVFVHVLQPAFFWESHPFSMMDCVEETDKGHVKMYCRVKDGMTRRLHAKASANGGSFETHVWLDGPYGTYMNLKPFHQFLLMAGGIGITAPFSHIQSLIAKGHSDITLNWAVADEAPLSWFKEEIDFMLEHNVKVNLFIGGTANNSETSSFASEKKEGLQVAKERSLLVRNYCMMDVYRLVGEGIVNSTGSLAILCCGPGGINDGTRKAIADNLDRTSNYVEYFEESFSW